MMTWCYYFKNPWWARDCSFWVVCRAQYSN